MFCLNLIASFFSNYCFSHAQFSYFFIFVSPSLQELEHLPSKAIAIKWRGFCLSFANEGSLSRHQLTTRFLE